MMRMFLKIMLLFSSKLKVSTRSKSNTTEDMVVSFVCRFRYVSVRSGVSLLLRTFVERFIDMRVRVQFSSVELLL